MSDENCFVSANFVLSQIDKQHTVTITGNATGFSFKKFNAFSEQYSDKLVDVIKNYLNDGYNTFIIGSANLIDIMAGEALLKVKTSFPEIIIIFAKIFNGFEYTYYNSFDHFKRLRNIISNADISFNVFEKYSPGIEKAQKRFLCSGSSSAITFYEKESNQFNEIKRAVARCENIINLDRG